MNDDIYLVTFRDIAKNIAGFSELLVCRYMTQRENKDGC